MMPLIGEDPGDSGLRGRRPAGAVRTDAAAPTMQPPRSGTTQRAFPLALEPFGCTRFEMAQLAFQARDLGMDCVGICCGAGPHHVRAMAEALGRQVPASKYSPSMNLHRLLRADVLAKDATSSTPGTRDQQVAIRHPTAMQSITRTGKDQHEPRAGRSPAFCRPCCAAQPSTGKQPATGHIAYRLTILFPLPSDAIKAQKNAGRLGVCYRLASLSLSVMHQVLREGTAVFRRQGNRVPRRGGQPVRHT